MVAELSALQQIINSMTGLNGLPPVIIECFVTTVYTCKVLLLELFVETNHLSSAWRLPHLFPHGQPTGRHGRWLDHPRRHYSRGRD